MEVKFQFQRKNGLPFFNGERLYILILGKKYYFIKGINNYFALTQVEYIFRKIKWIFLSFLLVKAIEYLIKIGFSNKWDIEPLPLKNCG